jgi:hypothetical protein
MVPGQGGAYERHLACQHHDIPGFPRDRGRWSSRRPAHVVLRLLRDEDLDAVSREIGARAVTACHFPQVEWGNGDYPASQ